MNELILLVELEHVENTKMAEASAKKIKELIKEHPALDSEIGEILVVNCQTPEKKHSSIERTTHEKIIPNIQRRHGNHWRQKSKGLRDYSRT